MKKKEKILIYSSIVFVVFLVLANFLFAPVGDVGGGVLTPGGRGVLTPGYWNLDGSSLVPGKSTYTIDSSYIRYPLRNADADTPLTISDYFLTVDTTTSSIAITLPTAVSNSGLEFVVKKIDASANEVYINTTSSQKIDGLSSSTITSQWSYVSLISDGSNWLKK